jgi:hypothetical protein
MSVVPKSSSVISSLTAAEMSIAERAAGLSITTLEDPDYPKVDLLAALGWVHAKRSDTALSFKAYKESRTLTEITEQLGMGGDDDEPAGDDDPADGGEDPSDAEGNERPTPAKKSSTSKRSASPRSS